MHLRKETSMLKRLFNEYDFAVERILLKEYRRLSLTMQEVTVLVALFSIYKKRKTFSINALARRVEYSKADIGNYVESLYKKQFITFDLEKKDGKEREVFDIDLTFKRIEALYAADKKAAIIAKSEKDVTETIRLFEQGMGRILKAYELEMIRSWYENETYEHDAIIKAIDSAGARVSVKHVEQLLTQQIMPKVEIDDDTEKILDAIFKKMK